MQGRKVTAVPETFKVVAEAEDLGGVEKEEESLELLLM